MGYISARRHSMHSPQLTHRTKPEYNVDALRIGLEGRVTLAAEIRTDGIAHNIRVIHGLGAGLDEQAVDCLRQWTFRPAVGPDGNPLTAYATIEIDFSLKNSR